MEVSKARIELAKKLGLEATNKNLNDLKLKKQNEENEVETVYIPNPPVFEEIPKNDSEREFFEECLASLTPTEKMIFDFHLSGIGTKEIMAELCITENTIKFHNKNIYSKGF